MPNGFTSSRFFGRLIQLASFLIVTAVCYIPLWIFLFVFHVAGPVGFWQKLAMLGLGAVIGGGLQFIFFLFWCAAVFFILTELAPPKKRIQQSSVGRVTGYNKGSKAY